MLEMETSAWGGGALWRTRDEGALRQMHRKETMDHGDSQLSQQLKCLRICVINTGWGGRLSPATAPRVATVELTALYLYAYLK